MFNLKKHGILGNNRRISEYILPNNLRSDYPLVDDKIKTDFISKKANLPVPELFLKIEKMSDTKYLHKRIQDLSEFVIKPARGSMGNGITIVNEVIWNEKKSKTFFVTSNRNTINYNAFIYSISSILSGLYSLNGQPDRVLIQRKLQVHPFFKKIISSGVPDVRVVLFKGVPVMAMARLPTDVSRGKGNLHQGAVGCGVNISNGEITKAIQRNRIITKHPDTKQEFSNLKIPFWNETLDLAVKSASLVKIGYLGVDIVIQPESGPILLEMNARPGLSIQLANQSGLEPRLKLVEENLDKLLTHENKITFAKNTF